MSPLQVFQTTEMLSAAAAEFILDQAQRAVASTGRFTLALSGGRTPEQLFRLLRTAPFVRKMPWQNTLIFWGDERCVPLNDERNNAHIAFSLLLEHVDIPAANIFRIPVDLPPVTAAQQYEQTLHRVFDPNAPRFDLILLGLGSDGHTASLFPGTNAVEEKTRWVTEVFVESHQMSRITMTLPLLNQAKNILFLVSGEEKAEILTKILKPQPENPAYPAQLVQPENGHLRWFVEAGAAVRL